MKFFSAIPLLAFALAGTAPAAEHSFEAQPASALINGEVMAVAYSGFREGQYPDRGDGAINPSAEEILEDLEILVAHNFGLIRLYDSGDNSELTLRLIRENELPIKVMLGAWIDAELSNHEGCSWCDEPIPDEKLEANKLANLAEITRTITLANEYDDIVVAVNVANEALPDWTDHLVPVEKIIAYVRIVKAAIAQPVTVAETHYWWTLSGAELGAELDFLGVHTYPVWEDQAIDNGLNYTIETLAPVQAAFPDKTIAILEAGWTTTSVEFGERANEAAQLRYYRELAEWARDTNTTVFWFEAFDEPWKGDPNRPDGAEKHWGLFFVDRSPKQVAREILEETNRAVR